ncbi:phage portal protein [Thermoanaerobacter sp. A7A]|uniref:phage portal protein n=1 Tax=Thermoanaerobacter sp. A7A TaxID=1350366 RepID=UPI0003FA3F96|nr:phage portal protein [Thermoanaerobacter sp. A7A]
MSKGKGRLKVLKLEKDIDSIFSRQPNIEEQTFPEKLVQQYNLLVPYYDPIRLYNIVENTSMLSACIETMQANVDGFGHDFLYVGDKSKKFDTEVIAEKERLNEFFKAVNETQSFVTLRTELRQDLEVTGNAYIEVVRFPNGKLAMLYRADAKYIRLQVKQSESIPVKVRLVRDGKEMTITVYRRFRRFCMLVNPTQGTLRWFKEYGDPRRMCAVTGKYEDELEPGEQIQELASEIIHLKLGNGIYGVPRWIGLTSVILGLQNADFVNYDLFDNQVVPPLAVLVSNGVLTSDSVEDLKYLFEQKKGVKNFHKILILEAIPASADDSLEDVKGSAKVDLKEFSMARKDDAIFKQYIELAEKRIRSRYRLPPLYLGVAEEYSRSTSDTSKLVAEEQVFKPERNKFDEIVNFTIMKELGAKYWKFMTVGPRMIEGNEIITAFEKFAEAGVLTINQGIRIVNHVLGLDATEYDQVWANYPVPLVMELLKQQRLKDIEELDKDYEGAVKTIKDAKERFTKFKEWLCETHKDSETVMKTVSDINTILNELEDLYANKRN